jgi:hypothetical protein
MEHKFKTMEVLKKHKIHLKAKAWMNISLLHDIDANGDTNPPNQCLQNGVGIPNGVSRRQSLVEINQNVTTPFTTTCDL